MNEVAASYVMELSNNGDEIVFDNSSTRVTTFINMSYYANETSNWDKNVEGSEPLPSCDNRLTLLMKNYIYVVACC